MNATTKVFVYFNLHKKCWSVKALDGEKKGRVIMHTQELSLRDITFKVSEAGRQRVLAEKRKNVHAGVVGYLDEPVAGKEWTLVRYNPYVAGHFFNCDNGHPVHTADWAVLADRKVWIA